MQGASGVGCAVIVLCAGITEVDCFWVDDRAVAFFGFVVDYCGVWACGGNGVEGEADEVLVFSECMLVPYKLRLY